MGGHAGGLTLGGHAGGHAHAAHMLCTCSAHAMPSQPANQPASRPAAHDPAHGLRTACARTSSIERFLRLKTLLPRTTPRTRVTEKFINQGLGLIIIIRVRVARNGLLNPCARLLVGLAHPKVSFFFLSFLRRVLAPPQGKFALEQLGGGARAWARSGLKVGLVGLRWAWWAFGGLLVGLVGLW